MNKIILNQVIPTTLKDRIHESSDIWGKQVNFDKGIFYLIKAVSGSGKSTFINSIYGLRNDYSGSITYDTTPIKDKTSDDLSTYRKQELSIVFQDLRLFEGLTAKENILLKADKTDLNQLEHWCERLQITNLLNKPCGQLSYGERQRIAIIRSLNQSFDFLLLDEPFSHLDQENGKRAYKLITEIAAKNNAAIIMTSLGNENFLHSNNIMNL